MVQEKPAFCKPLIGLQRAHSPHLPLARLFKILRLNHAQPNEVRIFMRQLADETQITSMSDAPYFSILLEEMDLGELWYNLGEERLLPRKGESSR